MTEPEIMVASLYQKFDTAGELFDHLREYIAVKHLPPRAEFISRCEAEYGHGACGYFVEHDPDGDIGFGILYPGRLH